MSGYPCGEGRKEGDRTEDRYLLEPAPTGDWTGLDGTGECRPGRMIPEFPEGEGLESGMW